MRFAFFAVRLATLAAFLLSPSLLSVAHEAMVPQSAPAAVLKANGEYSEHFGDTGKLALPLARRFVVLTCFAGLSEGDAQVIHNEYIYDVRSGRLIAVEEATRAGQARSVTEVVSAHRVSA